MRATEFLLLLAVVLWLEIGLQWAVFAVLLLTGVAR